MIAVLVPSIVAFVAASLAFGGVMWTVAQKERTDRRDQWWKRVQWAADLARSEDDAATQIGMAALTAMIGETDKITAPDADLLRAIIEVVLGSGESQEDKTGVGNDVAGLARAEGERDAPD